MYRKVEGKGLRTSFAEAPRVVLDGGDSAARCHLEFDGSPLDEDGRSWVTVINFSHVLDFRFSDFELGLEITDSADFEYSLIELVDSTLLEKIISSHALERTAIPVTRKSDLRHYRISFDNHGTYDVVCTGIEISYRRSVRT